MPHRTTYFFPRQSPESREFDPSSSKLLVDHEKKISGTTSIHESANSKATGTGAVSAGRARHGEKITRVSHTSVYEEEEKQHLHGFTGDKIRGKQLAAFVNWLSDKKKKESHVRIKLEGAEDENEEHEQLLPQAPEAVPPEIVEVQVDHHLPTQERDQHASDRPPSLSGGNDFTCGGGKESGTRGFVRPFSLQRLSSLGSSSYAGSLFSGGTTTIFDGNWTSSTGAKGSTSRTMEIEEVEEDEERGKKSGMVQKSRESYYLQLTLAKRLTEQATLASEPMLLKECTSAVTSDVQTVSYGLWVILSSFCGTFVYP